MDCALHLHGLAIHASDAKYRSAVPGAGLLCQRGRQVAGLGAYTNSLGDPSQYVFVGTRPWQRGGWRLGALVGVVEGYRLKHGTATAFAAFTSTWRGEGADYHAVLIPDSEGRSPVTLQFSVSIPIP